MNGNRPGAGGLPSEPDSDPQAADDIARAEDVFRIRHLRQANYLPRPDVPAFVAGVLAAVGCELSVTVEYDLGDDVLVNHGVIAIADDDVSTLHLPRTLFTDLTDGDGVGHVGKMLMLHELAHLAPTPCAEHGPAFAANLLALVGAAFGSDASREFAEALDA